ncbi:hypothetical protein EHP00_1136 [Ecytonucleospora hepatopenaei]|uniref:Transposase Tc1-like domain-containing protein n=1 Tax=Ecytonucleospora hepatopenaei TaxID=646526 RepID=A0A1W0E4D3_9MICR|nr:hypothetical protein EHP00_1136 [Ecytonucleospora hepatopenaei]
MSVKQISCNHGLSQSAVKSILKKYTETRNTQRSLRGGDHRSRFDENQKNQIRQWVDKDLKLSLRYLVNKITNTFSMTVGKTSVDRVLRDYHYTLKRTTLVPEARNTERTINLRYEYAQMFMQLECDYPAENFALELLKGKNFTLDNLNK